VNGGAVRVEVKAGAIASMLLGRILSAIVVSLLGLASVRKKI
jgi:hypothetical protein